MSLTIRPYTPHDREAVLALLRLNTPAYFAAAEEADFIFYLDHELEYYFVADLDQQLVGCGGINFSGNPKTGKISWDMIHPDFHRKAIGSALLQHRIKTLKTFPDLEKIIVRTSQHAWRFYEKNGFQLVEITVDYWAPGFDLYQMEYAAEV